jgi:hypothetical protein
LKKLLPDPIYSLHWLKSNRHCNLVLSIEFSKGNEIIVCTVSRNGSELVATQESIPTIFGPLASRLQEIIFASKKEQHSEKAERFEESSECRSTEFPTTKL